MLAVPDDAAGFVHLRAVHDVELLAAVQVALKVTRQN